MKAYTTPPPSVHLVRSVPELAPYARTVRRLHPHRVDRDLPNDVSKVGGLFLWPSDEPWPMWEGNRFPFVPVWQLRKADFPEMPFPPGADLFQLLWTPYRDEDLLPIGGTCYLPVPKVFWRRAADVKSPITRIPRLADHGVDESDLDVSDNVPRMCSVHPEQIVELPHPDDLRWSMGDEGKKLWEKIGNADIPIPAGYRNENPHAKTKRELRESLYCDLCQCPGAKTGGRTHYTDDEGHTWEPLLVIPSFEYDVHSARYWQPVEDRFETSGRQVSELDHPMGLDLGRSQRVYVSVCRDLPGWPVQMNVSD